MLFVDAYVLIALLVALGLRAALRAAVAEDPEFLWSSWEFRALCSRPGFLERWLPLLGGLLWPSLLGFLCVRTSEQIGAARVEWETEKRRFRRKFGRSLNIRDALWGHSSMPLSLDNRYPEHRKLFDHLREAEAAEAVLRALAAKRADGWKILWMNDADCRSFLAEWVGIDLTAFDREKLDMAEAEETEPRNVDFERIDVWRPQ